VTLIEIPVYTGRSRSKERKKQKRNKRKSRRISCTFSTIIRSPTRRVGNIEEEGMKRSSENVDQRSPTTISLRNPSRPGHRRKPQLWHGIHRSEG